MMARTLPLPPPLRRYAPPASFWIALAIFIAFALLVPRFATFGNIENVLRVAAILCIVACGQAIVLILGGIEFSFGAAVALASVSTVLALPYGGPLVGFAAGAATVLAIGAINGALIARFALPPFLVTLGMLMIAAGAAASLAGGLPIDAAPSDLFSWPARGRVAGVPVPVIAAGIAVAVLYVLLAHTRIGRLWYLVGANGQAARLAGVPVRLATFLGYLAAAGFCSVSAIILTSRVASGQPSLAPNLSFDTIAACAIGGIPLAGGQGRASQVVCGVLVIAMMNNAVVLLNLPVAFQQLMVATVIIGAVLLQKGAGPLGGFLSAMVSRRRR
jgi:ribose/xylose/arabinose/galactoside ABC-type transport system permease subunit